MSQIPPKASMAINSGENMSHAPTQSTDDDNPADVSSAWFDPDVTTFGDRLAGAREVAQLTQAEMAKRLGVKLKTLRGWENDLSEPRANRLSMIAGLLNVPLVWLITGEGAGGPEDTDPALSRDVLAILTEIRDLKGQLSQAADRLDRLEKTLRATLKDEAR